MPSQMVTAASAVLHIDVDFPPTEGHPDGVTVRYYLFKCIIDGKLAFSFVSDIQLARLPQTTTSLRNYADLVIACHSRDVMKDRFGDPDRTHLLGYFEAHLDVEDVHSR